MISVDHVLDIHCILIKKFVGSDGLRDLGNLESALARPFQTFGGSDLFPDICSKAAAIGKSIAINHPFVDRNKRTTYMVMDTMLRSAKIRIQQKMRTYTTSLSQSLLVKPNLTVLSSG